MRRAAKKKMLSRLVVASAVRTHWRLLSSDAVEVADQKRTVARPQLSNSDALTSGPAKSPVCLRVGISSEGAVSGPVRVAFVAGLKVLLSRPPDQNLCVARPTGTDVSGRVEPRLASRSARVLPGMPT